MSRHRSLKHSANKIRVHIINNIKDYSMASIKSTSREINPFKFQERTLFKVAFRFKENNLKQKIFSSRKLFQ